MIYYKPITDSQKLTDIFSDIDFSDGYTYGGYIGFDENDNNVGHCLVKIKDYSCFLVSVECDLSDKLLTEGFIRSALNFSANRNAYMAFCSQENISDVLLTLGFEKNDNNVYSGDIPTLLKGSCCK